VVNASAAHHHCYIHRRQRHHLQGKETPFWRHVYVKNDLFTKTSSEQT
jgi:hypothetical protein